MRRADLPARTAPSSGKENLSGSGPSAARRGSRDKPSVLRRHMNPNFRTSLNRSRLGSFLKTKTAWVCLSGLTEIGLNRNWPVILRWQTIVQPPSQSTRISLPRLRIRRTAFPRSARQSAAEVSLERCGDRTRTPSMTRPRIRVLSPRTTVSTSGSSGMSSIIPEGKKIRTSASKKWNKVRRKR